MSKKYTWYSDPDEQSWELQTSGAVRITIEWMAEPGNFDPAARNWSEGFLLRLVSANEFRGHVFRRLNRAMHVGEQWVEEA